MVSLLEQYETETQQTNDDFDPDLSNPVSQLYFNFSDWRRHLK